LLPRKKYNNQCTGKTISPTPFSNTTAVASACPYEPGKKLKPLFYLLLLQDILLHSPTKDKKFKIFFETKREKP